MCSNVSLLRRVTRSIPPLLLSLLLLALSSVVLGQQPQPEGEAAEEPAADAGSSEEQAQALKAEADEAMFDLRYDDALVLYQRAYALHPNPALLYNQGRAHQARGFFPDAMRLLERFDAEAPEELKARVPRLGELLAEVRAKVSRLTVKCNVKGARVLASGQEVGQTPFVAPALLNSGPTKLRVTAKGHHPSEREVELPGGGALTVEIKLKPIATTGILQVRSPVTGAQVFVDGKRIGAVPAEIELAPGKHRVVLRHEDHEEAHTTVVLAAGDQKRISVPLEELPGLLEKWWFWTTLGVVSAGAVVVTIAATTEGAVEEGTIAPGQISAPLITF